MYARNLPFAALRLKTKKSGDASNEATSPQRKTQEQ